MLEKYGFAFGIRAIAIVFMIFADRKSIMKNLKRGLSNLKLNYSEQKKIIKYVRLGKLPNNYKMVKLFPIEKLFMIIFLSIRFISFGYLYRSYKNEPKVVDYYVLVSFIVFSFILFILPTNLSIIFLILIIVFVIYRIVEGINYLLCIIFVDRYKLDWRPHSFNRSILLLMMNYIEIIIGFAILYLVSSSIGYSKYKIISDPIEALYFSAVTITTLGYGDIKPISQCGQKLALMEPLLGFLLIVLVLGMFFLEAGKSNNKRKKLWKNRIKKAEKTRLIRYFRRRRIKH